MNDIEWIIGFTGMPVADPKAPKDPSAPVEEGPVYDPGAHADAFEKEARLKAMLLEDMRKKIALVKGSFQNAMSQEVTLEETYIGNLHKKARMLDVEGTQLDEADFEEIIFSQSKFSPATLKIIDMGKNAIINCSEDLKKPRNAAGGPLFSNEELEREFWTPLVRERVLPETFVADLYSLTQQMINETNKLYVAESDKRTKEQRAIVQKDGTTRALNGSKKALGLAGSIASNFGENGKLAALALNGMGDLIDAGQSMAEKMEKAEWGDVASIGLTAIKGLSSSLLTVFGVPKEVTSIVASRLDGGSAVAKAAGRFASGPDGVIDGAICLVEGLAKGLAAGATVAGQDHNEGVKKTLEGVADYLPGAVRMAVRGGQLIKNVRDGDSEAAMKSLNQALVEAFKMARTAQLDAATKDMKEDEAEKFKKQFEKESGRLEKSLEQVLESSPEAAARMAEKSRMAQHRAGLDELITDVAEALESAAAKAGLEADLANDLATLYPTQVKAQTVLDILFKDDFDGVKAAKPLADALRATFAEVAKEVPALASAADTRAKAMTDLATRLSTGMQSTLETLKSQQAAQRSYEEIIGSFTDGMRNGLTAALSLDGLAVMLKDANTGYFAKNVQEHVTKKKLEIAKAEVNAELEEMQAGLDSMSEAQKAGAEASGIDALIAKITLDRLLMKMAVNVVGGGADMLSKVVPGLAIASAGVRMVGQLIAAAQRAQQLKRWIDSRDDFEAAQSVLSSASRNFVKNQSEQLADHSIDAALELARLISAAAQLAGPAAGAGAIASGVVEGVAKVKEIIKKQYSEKQLEDAWKLFQKSMANPKNRRLALQVRAQHPTLAKYTIAWGAYVKGDLLARNALRVCGLTEASLNNPDSSLDKVVAYLEVFYEEDQQLYRSLDTTLAWVPQPLELSSRCWIKLKLAAQANKLWDKPSTGTVDGLLVKYEESIKAVDAADDQFDVAEASTAGVTEADHERCRAALVAQQAVLAKLSSALSAVEPTGAKADPETVKKFENTVVMSLYLKAIEKDKQTGTALKAVYREIAKLRKATATVGS